MAENVYRQNLNGVRSPCKNCQKRKELCHSTCGVYLKFKKDLEEYKAKVKAIKGYGE